MDEWGGMDWDDGDVAVFTNAPIAADAPISEGAVQNVPQSEYWPFGNDGVPDYVTPVSSPGVSFDPGSWKSAIQGIGSVIQSGLGMADLALRNVRALTSGQPLQTGTAAAKPTPGISQTMLLAGVGIVALLWFAKR